MEKIIIFGAGKYGRLLHRMLNCPNIRIGDTVQKVEYFCDNNQLLGEYVDGVKLIRPHQIKNIDEEYLIYISSNHIVDSVMKQLFELGIKNKVYLIPDSVYHFQLEGLFRIEMDISKPRLPYLECAIVRHCNLNCKGCSAFATIRGKEMMDVCKFEDDLKALKNLYSGIKYFKLFGGEPLLHPQLKEFIEKARQYFPDAELVVHSNGLLVLTVEKEILQIMSEHSVKFVFSVYPATGHIKRKIEQTLKQMDVVYEFREPVYEFKKIIDIKGRYDAEEIYKNCCKCINLIDGTLSCGIGYAMQWLEEKFDIEICKDKRQNCIDIHTTDLSGWQINAKLDSPSNLCSYCAFMDMDTVNDDNYYTWKCIGKEETQLTDWILDNECR